MNHYVILSLTASRKSNLEPGHSPLFGAQFFNVCSYIATPPYVLLASIGTALQLQGYNIGIL
jgi:hypothetical protein